MKKFLYLLVITAILSCNNERVLQLPDIENAKITEVLDVSPAYIFYDETQPDSTLLNRKNLISTTNWLINVDKRLTLKQAIPHIKFLQDKKRNAKMHKNENAKNYYTCNDTSIKNLGFLEFTDVSYKTKFSISDFLTELYINPSKKHQEYYINFINSDSLVIGNQTYIQGLNKKYFSETLKTRIKNDTLRPKIYLTFNHRLNFQDYIAFKNDILKLSTEPFDVSNNEFIY